MVVVLAFLSLKMLGGNPAMDYHRSKRGGGRGGGVE